MQSTQSHLKDLTRKEQHRISPRQTNAKLQVTFFSDGASRLYPVSRPGGFRAAWLGHEIYGADS